MQLDYMIGRTEIFLAILESFDDKGQPRLKV